MYRGKFCSITERIVKSIVKSFAASRRVLREVLRHCRKYHEIVKSIAESFVASRRVSWKVLQHHRKYRGMFHSMAKSISEYFTALRKESHSVLQHCKHGCKGKLVLSKPSQTPQSKPNYNHPHIKLSYPRRGAEQFQMSQHFIKNAPVDVFGGPSTNCVRVGTLRGLCSFVQKEWPPPGGGL